MLGIGFGLTERRGGAGLPAMHTDGLIAEWRFSEGSGTTVNDEIGSNDINLDLPTTPNYTWESKGITLASGLVQTPSITSARTIVVLYKVARGNTSGFCISGGPSGSGQGVLGSVISAGESYRVGVGSAVRPIRYRTDNNSAANILNRGEYILVFRQCASAFTSAIGFGGRHSTTTSRCTTFSIAWAGVYNDTLTDSERTSIYNWVRYNIAKPRGIYIHKDDCPNQADVAIIWGQSNADGRADISGLTAGEQAQTYSKSYILVADRDPRPTPPPALLDLGVNQTVNNPATKFGPETFLARQHDDNKTRRLYIAKTAEGGTWLAPESTGVAAANTWDVGVVPSSSLFHSALTDLFDVEQAMLGLGYGPNIRALFWMQGEQDATADVYADTYQTALGSLHSELKTYLGMSSLPIVIGRIRDQDPTFDATAVVTVRAAQAAYVAANPTEAVLIDTDSMALAADNVHYNSAGMKALGEAFYNAVTW